MAEEEEQWRVKLSTVKMQEKGRSSSQLLSANL
jgi:hypothetical protein